VFHIPISISPNLVSSHCGPWIEVRLVHCVKLYVKVLTSSFSSVTDWFFFMVLDIGNSAFDAIPLGTRFAIGLLQACAVRAAGFGTVAISTLAPAVK